MPFKLWDFARNSGYVAMRHGIFLTIFRLTVIILIFYHISRHFYPMCIAITQVVTKMAGFFFPLCC